MGTPRYRNLGVLIRFALRSSAQSGFDFRNVVARKVQAVEGFEILFELCDRACAEERRGHNGEPQDPGDGQLGGSTAQFDAFFKAESARWGKVIRQANITAE